MTRPPGAPEVILFAAAGGRAMLMELSVMEQCYHGVMEVVSDASVTEVARRYGIGRRDISYPEPVRLPL
jgi:hypothetical protein